MSILYTKFCKTLSINISVNILRTDKQTDGQRNKQTKNNLVDIKIKK